MRLDRLDGPLAGTLALTPSDRARPGHVQIYREAVAELASEAKGTRDVFLVFRSAGGQPSVDFEYFRFEQYRGELPLQKNEVKLELREGSAGGPKLGEFYPRGTGDRVGEFVANLEPAQGAGPLVLVVRAALAASRRRRVRLAPGKEHRLVGGSGPRAGAAARDAAAADPSAPTRPPTMTARRSHRVRFSAVARRESTGAGRPVAGMDGARVGVAAIAGRPRERRAAGAGLGRLRRAGVLRGAAMPQAASPPPRTDGLGWGATDGVEIAFQNAETTPAGPILMVRGWPDGHFDAPEYAGVTPAIRRRLAAAVAYRAAADKDGWTCEWRIPWELCGGAGPAERQSDGAQCRA